MGYCKEEVTTMRKLLFLAVIAALFTWSAAAQTAAQSQTSGSANTNTQAGAEGKGVQAQSSTEAGAGQQANISHQSTDKNKGAKAGESTNASANESANAQANSSSTSAASSGTLNAVLTRSLDARHAKEGQQVTAKTTSEFRTAESTEIPKGAKLIGHVTKAQARAKGDAESSLGIAFDKAVLKGGHEVPLHAVIQALSAPPAPAVNEDTYGSATSSASGEMAPQNPSGGRNRSGGGVVGAATGTVNNTVGAAGSTVGEVGNTTAGVAGQTGRTVGNASANATGKLSSTTTGVVGIPGVMLNSEASNATQGSLITSRGKDVKLESGTQMVLRVSAQ